MRLDGELVLTPLPSAARGRRADIGRRAKLNSLLEGQEAVSGEVGCGGWIRRMLHGVEDILA